MSTTSKATRACDYCRRRKARCDGVEMGGRCLTCTRHSVECTYNTPPKPRPTKSYVESLENRLASVEGTIREVLRAGNPSTFTKVGRNVDNSEFENDNDNLPKLAPLPPRAYTKRPHGDPLSFPEEMVAGDGGPLGESELHSVQFVAIQENLSPSFHGESSMLAFTNTLGEEWKFTGVHNLRSRRKEFWEIPEWMLHPIRPLPVPFEFPEMDLMLHLLDCYFDSFNIILPILHRPSFVRSVEEGLHKVNAHFGAVVLTVCAIGCRCTTDPRVTHGVTTSSSSTAWKLFNQISISRSRKVAFVTTSVYEAQLYPLVAIFLEGDCPPSSVWLVIGSGLRVMQGNGVHRKTFSAGTILERELWKRAFWVLIVLDRYFSTLLGRACGLRDEDFDAELPLQCDDADLEESCPNFPPAARPRTQMCCFLATIRLNRLLAFALRTIYSTRRSRVVLGYVGKSWEQHIVMALDSALNKWIDSVPEHLRWGSEASKKNKTYLVQSAFLWCQFYETQLLVHRNIALGDLADPERAAASVIICKNAAKCCIEIVESTSDVLDALLYSYLLTKSVFASSTFLVLMFRKKGEFDRDSPEYRVIEASKTVMRKTSERWRVSAYILHLLDVLSGMGNGNPTGIKLGPQEWHDPCLGQFILVDKDGVLCHEECSGVYRTQSSNEEQSAIPSTLGQPPEPGSEMESNNVDGSRSSVVPPDPLMHHDPTGDSGWTGIIWPSSEKGTDSGQRGSKTPDIMEGNWDYAFYDNFLNEISNLTGPL